MDHDQGSIPECILEHCPNNCLSGAEFKGDTEENSHEQQNDERHSLIEFKGDTEEDPHEQPKYHSCCLTEFKGDTDERQSVPEKGKQVCMGILNECIEKKQTVSENIKRFSRVSLKEYSEVDQMTSECQNDINQNRMAGFLFTENPPKHSSGFEKPQKGHEDNMEEKPKVPQNVKQFTRASLEEYTEENPVEQQNSLNGKPKKKRMKGGFQNCSCKSSREAISYVLNIILFLSLIGVLARSPRIAEKPCGPPCPRYWIGYEGMCYYFSKEKQDWNSSHLNCSSHNASLARTEEEMDVVMRLKGKDIYWIGLRRYLSKDWTWTDGEKATMEVSGAEGGDCAYLDNNGEAVASGCRTKLTWICTKPAAYSTKDVTDT